MGMTEAEIKKALECAFLYQTTDVRTYKGIPIEEFSKAVLDLINRKNAENEKVRTELDRLTIYFDEAVEAKLKTARAEAIKEVLEKVKKYTVFSPFLGDVVCAEYLDQIAKEMGCGE